MPGWLGTGVGFARRAGLLATGVAALLAGCTPNPATGTRQLVLIDEAEEIELGRAAGSALERGFGLVEDPALRAYVADVGHALAARSARPHLPWRFGVLDAGHPNAFALPGGGVYVTRGLLVLLDSEAQLAGVLAHEIGHVAARHSVAYLSRVKLFGLGPDAQRGLSPGDDAPAREPRATGWLQRVLRNGIAAEREADELGFRYAHAAGYDPGAMARVFVALARTAALDGVVEPAGWPAQHPPVAERVLAARRGATATPSPAGLARVVHRPDAAPVRDRDRDTYLARIDGLVVGPSPNAPAGTADPAFAALAKLTSAPRLALVRLPRAMSLAEFARRTPGGASLERLAVLNQVEDPHAVVPAGTIVKHVTLGRAPPPRG